MFYQHDDTITERRLAWSPSPAATLIEAGLALHNKTTAQNYSWFLNVVVFVAGCCQHYWEP